MTGKGKSVFRYIHSSVHLDGVRYKTGVGTRDQTSASSPLLYHASLPHFTALHPSSCHFIPPPSFNLTSPPVLPLSHHSTSPHLHLITPPPHPTSTTITPPPHPTSSHLHLHLNHTSTSSHLHFIPPPPHPTSSHLHLLPPPPHPTSISSPSTSTFSHLHLHLLPPPPPSLTLVVVTRSDVTGVSTYHMGAVEE